MNPNSCYKNFLHKKKPNSIVKPRPGKDLNTNGLLASSNRSIKEANLQCSNVSNYLISSTTSSVHKNSDLFGKIFKKRKLTDSSACRSVSSPVCSSSISGDSDNKGSNQEHIKGIIGNDAHLSVNNEEITAVENVVCFNNEIIKNKFRKTYPKNKKRMVMCCENSNCKKSEIVSPSKIVGVYDGVVLNSSNLSEKSKSMKSFGKFSVQCNKFEVKTDTLPTPDDGSGSSHRNHPEGVVVDSEVTRTICKSEFGSSKVSNCKTDLLYHGNSSQNDTISKISLNNVTNDEFKKNHNLSSSSRSDNNSRFLQNTYKETESSESSVDLELFKKDEKSGQVSLKNKPDLAKLKLNAYDEDGNLNMKQFVLRDFIHFNPPHNPMKSDVFNDTEERKESINSDFETISDSEYEEPETVSATPRVKVGADGRIVVDPDSLIIKSSSIDKRIIKLEKSKIVKEDENGDVVKTKKRRKRNQDTMSSLFGFKEQKAFCRIWTPEETLKFYKVLNDFGADFSVMLEAFPYRTRRQLKRKFLNEEKIHLNYIDLAMKKRDSIDFEALEKELRKKQLEREEKRKEKEKRTEEEKKMKQLLLQEVAKYTKGRKRLQRLDCFDFPLMEVRRVGRKYDEKVKRMKQYITRMKKKYLEEARKTKEIKKKSSKNNDVVVNDNDSNLFDLAIPLYKKMFFSKPEEIFIQEIKSEDDLDLFISLSSEMYCKLGSSWRGWVKKKVVDQLLNKEGDCEAKEAGRKMKAVMEEKERMEKLERCYQLFSDPYDYVDPSVSYGD